MSHNGHFIVHIPEALAQCAGNPDEDVSCGQRTDVHELLQAAAVNAPDLRKLNGSDGGAGQTWMKNVYLANGFASADTPE